jgi:hypothetical protein
VATAHRPKRPKAKPAGLGRKGKSVFRSKGVKKAKTTTVVAK